MGRPPCLFSKGGLKFSDKFQKGGNSDNFLKKRGLNLRGGENCKCVVADFWRYVLVCVQSVFIRKQGSIG